MEKRTFVAPLAAALPAPGRAAAFCAAAGRKLAAACLCVVALLAAVACGSPESKALSRASSSGKTCEVLIAIDKPYSEGEVRALLDSILASPQDGLPQPEPRFSLLTVPTTSLQTTKMFQMHRNIVVCDIRAENPDKFYIHHNQWAEPQVVVDIAARTPQSLCEMLRKHAPRILDEIYSMEYARMANAFYRDRDVELMNRVQQKFGFALTLPSDYVWANDDDGFLWLRKETKDFGLGVVVNAAPYRMREQLDTTRIWNRLDTMMRRHIAGPAEGSYMGTERRIAFDTRPVSLAGSSYCIETRGLWRLFGDFMGGPFVCYTLLSPDGTQVVDIMGYVYCPRFDKRDYLMQVDGICHSIRWPDAE